jgi:hypothetical protein
MRSSKKLQRCNMSARKHAKKQSKMSSSFLHTSQYISVDSEITGTVFPISPYDDSGVRVAGLSGWKVVGTIPHTIGTALQNTEGFNSVWAGGVGGSVIGAYVLLELEITANNLEMMKEEYLEETV